MVKPSKDFTEKEALIKLKHECNIKELQFMRDSEAIHHDHEMERQRIKSAEIRKTQMRRQDAFKY